MKKLISFFSILVILSSCEKDVNVNIPKKDPKLVINSVLGKDSVLTAYIGVIDKIKCIQEGSVFVYKYSGVFHHKIT